MSILILILIFRSHVAQEPAAPPYARACVLMATVAAGLTSGSRRSKCRLANVLGCIGRLCSEGRISRSDALGAVSASFQRLDVGGLDGSAPPVTIVRARARRLAAVQEASLEFHLLHNQHLADAGCRPSSRARTAAYKARYLIPDAEAGRARGAHNRAQYARHQAVLPGACHNHDAALPSSSASVLQYIVGGFAVVAPSDMEVPAVPGGCPPVELLESWWSARARRCTRSAFAATCIPVGPHRPMRQGPRALAPGTWSDVTTGAPSPTRCSDEVPTSPVIEPPQLSATTLFGPMAGAAAQRTAVVAVRARRAVGESHVCDPV